MLPSILPRTCANIASKSLSQVGALVHQKRAFASVLSGTPSGSGAQAASSSIPPTPKGHLRPHFGIQVNPNHGLFGFFRRVEKDGEVDYEVLEPKQNSKTASGPFELGMGHVLLHGSHIRHRSVVVSGGTPPQELQGLAYSLVCSP